MSKKQAGDLKLAGALVCCLILGTSMVSIIAFYSSILNTKQNTINSLNSDITERDAQISSLNSEKELMQSQIANLTFEMIGQGQTGRMVDYPGYIKFDRFGGGSTTETGEIYAQVIWSTNNRVYFDEKKIFEKDLHFRFPVLPTSNLEIRVGYDDPQNGTANIIVAVSYVY